MPSDGQRRRPPSTRERLDRAEHDRVGGAHPRRIPDHQRVQVHAPVGQPDAPALAGRVAIAGAVLLLHVDGHEPVFGRRAVGGQLGVHVRGAGLDGAVLARRVQVAVPAHEAAVVGVAAPQRGRHAHHVPVAGQLGRIARIQAQAATAHLPNRDVGGHGGHVHEHVHLGAVPPLAEQAARAQQRLGLAGAEQPRGPVGPRARGEGGTRAGPQHGDAVLVIGLQVEPFSDPALDPPPGVHGQHGEGLAGHERGTGAGQAIVGADGREQARGRRR